MLHVAWFRGNAAIVTLLLAKGADPNLQNNQGQTSLHVAAIAGKADVVSALLKGPVACDKTAQSVTHENAGRGGGQRRHQEAARVI